VQFGYGLNYLIDIENAVIVDVEPTPARTYDEVEATKKISTGPSDVLPSSRSGWPPIRLTGLAVSWAGLSATGSCRISRFAMPVSAMMAHSLDATFVGTDGECLHLPEYQVLRTTGTVHGGHMLRYRASKFDCDVCTHKMQYCPNTPARQVPRDINEYARDVARRTMRIRAPRSCKTSKPWHSEPSGHPPF
jgi:hypothetical protein